MCNKKKLTDSSSLFFFFFFFFIFCFVDFLPKEKKKKSHFLLPYKSAAPLAKLLERRRGQHRLLRSRLAVALPFCGAGCLSRACGFFLLFFLLSSLPFSFYILLSLS